MYISEVCIENFRCFHRCRVMFQPKLTVVVGENNIGKTNLLAALGLILSPDASMFSRHLDADDVWDGWRSEGKLPTVKVQLTLAGFETIAEKALVAKWLLNSPPNELRARITYEYRPLPNVEAALPEVLPVDTYEWTIYGGEVERERIDFRDLAQIRLELLPALRDAERELSRGSRRRLGNLITRFKPDDFDDQGSATRQSIDSALSTLNATLEKAEPVAESQKQLNARLKEVSGESSAQSALFRPSKTGFDDLVRNLQVLIQDQSGLQHGVELNGLGYNNLLYTATLLTDFYQRRKLSGTQGITLPVVAIEEPEAHLHPHLQKFLNRYFANSEDGQVIVTTHSTHVSSSVDPSHLVVLHRGEHGDVCATSIADLFRGAPQLTEQFSLLRRYLDATRSTLFFGRSVMLVEGLAEAILLPVIAKSCLGFDSDDKGVSIVAVQGVCFRPFAALFGRNGIRRKCAILADSDPGNDLFPLDETSPEYQVSPRVKNLQSGITKEQEGYVQVFNNLKTLEHDIVVAGNRNLVEKALVTACDLSDQISSARKDEAVAIPESDVRGFCKALLTAISRAKGVFAQALAEEIARDGKAFAVPKYIRAAFEFLFDEALTEEADG